MKIAVVGSRKRSFWPDGGINKDTKKEVEDFVGGFDINDVVISGGCRGVDSWAVDAATKHGMKTHVCEPFIHDTMDYGKMVQEYYRRNREVVDASDMVYAFVTENAVKKGGTWYTIKYARQKGKRVVLK